MIIPRTMGNLFVALLLGFCISSMFSFLAQSFFILNNNVNILMRSIFYCSVLYYMPNANNKRWFERFEKIKPFHCKYLSESYHLKIVRFWLSYIRVHSLHGINCSLHRSEPILKKKNLRKFYWRFKKSIASILKIYGNALKWKVNS